MMRVSQISRVKFSNGRRRPNDQFWSSSRVVRTVQAKSASRLEGGSVILRKGEIFSKLFCLDFVGGLPI